MKKIIYLCFMIVVANNAFAQKFQGLVHSNYSATQGTFYNPAKLGQNRNGFGLELFSVNLYANNNVYQFKKDSLLKGRLGYTNTNNTMPISLTAPMIDVHLPNFQFNFKNKIGIAVTTRMRVFNQANEFNPYLIDFYKNASTNGTPTSINDTKGFNFNIHAISDIGLSGGINVFNTNDLALNVGASLRMYRGAGYFNFNNKGIVGTLIQGIGNNPQGNPNPDLINISKLDLDISSSAYDINKLQNGFNSPTEAFNTVFKQAAGKGFGGDVGGELIIKNNNRKKNYKGAYIPYSIKLGASIHDLGALKYNDVKQIRVYKTNALTTILNSDSISTYSGDLAKTRAYLKRNNLNADSSTVSITNKLPTTLNLYGDFSITNKFFIAAAAQLSMVTATERYPYYYNQFSIVPRLETKVIDIALPISYNMISKDEKLGAALRLGPLSVGSDDLSLLLKDSKGGNLYLNVHFNINKKRKKELPKPIEEDGYQSSEKKVTYTIVNNKTQIDTVIINKTYINNTIKTDTIKQVVAPAEIKTEISPKIDTVKEVVYKTDTVKQVIIKTDTVKQIIEKNIDTDNDGITDDKDKCPTIFGTIKNEGCPEEKKEVAVAPVIKESVKKRIQYAAKAIQFETNKSIIKSISFKSLNDVVKIVNEYTDYNLKIDGHSDNVGKPEKNKTLSQNRANAVAAYFAKKGIDSNRLIAEGFGDTQPKTTNKTKAGKAMNRRVELNLVLPE